MRRWRGVATVDSTEVASIMDSASCLHLGSATARLTIMAAIILRTSAATIPIMPTGAIMATPAISYGTACTPDMDGSGARSGSAIDVLMDMRGEIARTRIRVV